MDLCRTDKTYATRANAVKALQTLFEKRGTTLEDEHWVIMVNEAGRFAPAVVGRQYIERCYHFVISVIG